MLSQLSYIPRSPFARVAVGVLGFEPRTSALSELRSSQLSYTPFWVGQTLLSGWQTGVSAPPPTKQKSQTLQRFGPIRQWWWDRASTLLISRTNPLDHKLATWKKRKADSPLGVERFVIIRPSEKVSTQKNDFRNLERNTQAGDSFSLPLTLSRWITLQRNGRGRTRLEICLRISRRTKISTAATTSQKIQALLSHSPSRV